MNAPIYYKLDTTKREGPDYETPVPAIIPLPEIDRSKDTPDGIGLIISIIERWNRNPDDPIFRLPEIRKPDTDTFH